MRLRLINENLQSPTGVDRSGSIYVTINGKQYRYFMIDNPYRRDVVNRARQRYLRYKNRNQFLRTLKKFPCENLETKEIIVGNSRFPDIRAFKEHLRRHRNG